MVGPCDVRIFDYCLEYCYCNVFFFFNQIVLKQDTNNPIKKLLQLIHFVHLELPADTKADSSSNCEVDRSVQRKTYLIGQRVWHPILWLDRQKEGFWKIYNYYGLFT